MSKDLEKTAKLDAEIRAEYNATPGPIIGQLDKDSSLGAEA